MPEYALSILADPAAAKYVDGSGFHLYGGKIEAMSQVHQAFPGKNLYFTEQMVIGSNITNPVQRLIIGATRNWSRNVLLWNLAADPKNQPHTDNGGCTMCQGAITIDGNTVTRNAAYYTLAHASKLVRPGSVRIESSGPESLPNVAFSAPGGRKVLIVVNRGRSGAGVPHRLARQGGSGFAPGGRGGYLHVAVTLVYSRRQMAINRRNFLFRTAGAAAAAGLPAAAKVAREPGVKLKLGLNAYSFDKPLRDGSMTLTDAVHFCAQHGVDALDPTGYYFPGLSRGARR